MISGIDEPYGPPVVLGDLGRADSQLWRLRLHGVPFFILRQRGAFPDIAYDHGRLLADEIACGGLPEIVGSISRGIDRERDIDDWVSATAFTAYSRRIFRHTSEEFQQAAAALAEGFSAVKGGNDFDRDDMRDVLVAVETGGVLEGLYQLTSGAPLLRRLSARLGQLLVCTANYRNDDVKRWVDRVNREGRPEARKFEGRSKIVAFFLLFWRRHRLRKALQNLASPRNRCGYACTGICIPASGANDGMHIHARNFDAEVYQWNSAQVLALIDETDANRHWHKYAALGTAGLIYPGGISGVNDAGLAVSIHELSTTRYRSGFLFGEGDIAPYVQQRILREASTLDEAADIARATKHFGAWTLFCSHATSGEAMRIELNGDRVRVERHNQPTAQSNHFTHPDMVERQFDLRDPHFTPSFGKWLETHARFNLIQEALSRGAGNLDGKTAAKLLASGDDWYLRQIAGASAPPPRFRRSFGRVPRKVYGQMTSVVRADPERRSGSDELWVTLGERKPASHGRFAGWKIDWERLMTEPLADDPIGEAETFDDADKLDWEDSLVRFVDACIAVSRPRYPDKTFMMRDPTPAERAEMFEQADTLLSGAVEQAGRDDVIEIPYHFMRARIRHQRGKFEDARKDWDILRNIWAGGKGRSQGEAADSTGEDGAPPVMHPYEAALVLTLSTVTEDELNGKSTDWPGRAARLEEARRLLQELRDELFGPGAPGHHGIREWLGLIDEIERGPDTDFELPDENFVTIE